MTNQLDTKSLDIDVGEELSLHVNDTGAGPPLILLHGFTGSSDTWEPMLPSLASAHRVITVDLPGHGRSSAPANPQRYALVSFANDLARVLDALSIDRAAVMGYSMGGRSALRFALAFPDRLATLVLESTSPGIADPELRQERISMDAALAERIESDGIAAFVNEWESLPLWESQRDLPETVREKLRNQRLSNRPVGLANSLRGAGAGADVSVHNQLGRIQSPALVIAGALDSRYVEIGSAMAAAMPNAGTFVVQDAGHAVHLEQPRVLAEVILSFLRGARPPVAGGSDLID